MGKPGYDPKKKQSSTISNAQLLSLMDKYNFEVKKLYVPDPNEELEPGQEPEPIPQPVPLQDFKKTARQAVAAARRKFGDFVITSSTGESVYFEGHHVENKQPVSDIRVKLSHMLGNGERAELYKLTGIPELKVTRD